VESGLMIEVKDIVAAAQAKTGLSDAGDAAIFEGLGVLLIAYQTEAKLTEAGLQRSINALIDALANRMRVEDWLAKHPDLLVRPILKPMFVFGLPRTGTTLTINLLNADPARRSLLRWEAFDSVPPPRLGELHGGPRFARSQAQTEMALRHAPHISAIHHEDADSPTECQFAMAPSFCAQLFDAQAAIPSYRDWLLHKADYLPAFRYEKRLLQLLQAQAPGRWTLKNPWHPLFLNELTTIFPDAQLVMTHRDPVEVVGSACSLIRVVREMFSETVDLKLIGRQMLEIFSLMIARQNDYRVRHGVDAIFDIQYDAQLRDPLGQMRALYGRFDEPFTPAVQSAMEKMLAENPKGKHGRHEYALRDYGLTRAGVRAHFSAYIDQFNIPVSG
jgi:hypothetical protein